MPQAQGAPPSLSIAAQHSSSHIHVPAGDGWALAEPLLLRKGQAGTILALKQSTSGIR